MNFQYRIVVVLLIGALLVACSKGGVKQQSGSDKYKWGGEKYGIVEVELVDNNKNDDNDLINLSRVDFRTHTVSRLERLDLFDINSTNKITIFIEDMHFKSGYIPQLARLVSGPDYVVGRIQLEKEGAEMATFDMNIEYNNRSKGTAKYQWVGRKAAILVGESILSNR